MNRSSRKHFIIFNNGGVISATTPKDWARANQKFFPEYNFNNSDNTPTVDVIEKYLLTKLKYTRVENEEIVICYPFKEL